MRAPVGFLIALALAWPSSVRAERTLELVLRPLGDPQIAVWLEDENGTFIDTLMVTSVVGSRGLGNRPGRYDLGSALLWPYGRREMVLPVWAHRRAVLYDRYVFQDCREGSLGWHEIHSSNEPFYCRPMTETEMSVDTITCPSTMGFRTDKGIPLRMRKDITRSECEDLVRSQLETSFYPPRSDLTLLEPARDWPGVGDYADINDLDGVSQATPPSGVPYSVRYSLPGGIPPGRYHVYVEVNQEYDINGDHDYGFFVDQALSDYGIDWWGQPSLVWQVPITIGANSTTAETTEYIGYGAYDGQDGQIRPPDGTITTGVPGSGTGRLATLDGTAGVKARVRYTPNNGPQVCEAMNDIREIRIESADHDFVEVTFEASEGAEWYVVRYAEGHGSIDTEATFEAALPGPQMSGEEMTPGEEATIRIDRLRPETEYTIAIRGYNECQDPSTITSLDVKTPRREFTTVDACFIATAAHGSLDDPSVVTLRRFRDNILMKTETGRALIDAYYRMSPPLADHIRDDDTARAVTRAALAPVVWAASAFE